MAVSGFDIKKIAAGSAAAHDPWFVGNSGTYASVSDDGGNVQIVTAAPHGLEIGDKIDVVGTVYNFGGQSVITINSTTTFTVAVPFTATDMGNWFENDAVTFEDTPENFLRELHVQFDTTVSVGIEISLDGGLSYMALNNANELIGLATFTFFVVKGSEVNFRTTSAAATAGFTIVVTGA